MGKRLENIERKAGKNPKVTLSVIVALITVLIALTIIFLVYPDALRTIADAFDSFKIWFLGLFGL